MIIWQRLKISQGALIFLVLLGLRPRYLQLQRHLCQDNGSLRRLSLLCSRSFFPFHRILYNFNFGPFFNAIFPVVAIHRKLHRSCCRTVRKCLHLFTILAFTLQIAPPFVRWMQYGSLFVEDADHLFNEGNEVRLNQCFKAIARQAFCEWL